jgi:hypothetical protein
MGGITHDQKDGIKMQNLSLVSQKGVGVNYIYFYIMWGIV